MLVHARALALLLVFFVAAPVAALKTKTEQHVAMEAILAELNTQYGMAKFKARMFGVDVASLRAKYGALIDRAETLEEHEELDEKTQRESLSPEQFRQLMIGMIAELRDGHVNLNRLSSEGATLGLLGAPVGEKLIVTMVRPELMVSESSTVDIRAGDEILAIDGVPVLALAQRNLLYTQGGTFADRFDTAMVSVVNRFEAFQELPKEGTRARLTLKRGELVYEAHLRWVHNSDFRLLLQRFPRHLSSPFRQSFSEDVPVPYGFRGTVRSYFRTGLLSDPQLSSAIVDVGQLVNSDIDRSVDSVKHLAKVNRIQAYMVRYEGKNIGVLRIPSYSPGGVQEMRAEYAWIAEALRRLDALTDVLVIDQLSNTGGMVYYAVRLLGLFGNSEAPMQTVLADYKLSTTLLSSWQPGYFHDLVYGTPPSHADLKFYEQHYKEIKAKFDRGEEWTGLISAFDLQVPTEDEPGKIFPAKEGSYSKPVVVLNDRMSGSGGDFFPAMMQFNGRSVIMGETSCGLGGPVYRRIDSMPGSEMSFRCTSAYTELPNGWPIENIGVVPDLPRSVSMSDLRSNFRSYARDVLSKAVEVSTGKVTLKVKKAESAGSQLREEILGLVQGLEDVKREEYITRVKLLTELAHETSESDWADVIVPLPSSLLKDQILLTLFQRLEVGSRLHELMALPEYRSQKKLIQALLDLIVATPAVLTFADPCTLRLRMVPLRSTQRRSS